MHFMGQQAISRSTRGTGRVLIGFSIATWFVKFYDIPMQDLNVYGVQVGEISNHIVFHMVLASFLMVGHVLNWYGDHLAYKRWNIADKVTLQAGFGTATALVTKLDSVLRTVEEKTGNDSERRIALDMLKEIRSEVISLNSFAWLCVYVWHLVVPVAACVVSFAYIA